MLSKWSFRTFVEQRLSVNDLWLLEHMVTAFWHTFGISGGLRITPITDLRTVQYPKGPDGHYVSAPAMRGKLDDYIRWLESYQESWGTARYNHVYPAQTLVRGLLHPDQPYWGKVVKMIELLQIGVSPTPTSWPDHAPCASLVAFLQQSETEKGQVTMTRDEEGIVHILYRNEQVFAARMEEFVQAFFYLFGMEDLVTSTSTSGNTVE